MVACTDPIPIGKSRRKSASGIVAAASSVRPVIHRSQSCASHAIVFEFIVQILIV